MSTISQPRSRYASGKQPVALRSRFPHFKGFTAITGQHGLGRTFIAASIMRQLLAEGTEVTVIDLGRGGAEYGPHHPKLTLALRPIQAINALNRLRWHAEKVARLTEAEQLATPRPILIVEGYEALVALVPSAEHLLKSITDWDSRFVDAVVCLNRVTPDLGYPNTQYEPLVPGHAPSLAAVKRRWPQYAEKSQGLIQQALAKPDQRWALVREWGQDGPRLWNF